MQDQASDHIPNLSPQRALIFSRAIWGVPWVVTLALFGVVYFVAQPSLVNLPGLLPMIPVIVALAMAPVAYIARLRVFRSGWANHAIAPRTFLVGNLVHFALIEVVMVTGLIFVWITGHWLPSIGGTVIGSVVLLLNWPKGQLLYPEPRDALR